MSTNQQQHDAPILGGSTFEVRGMRAELLRQPGGFEGLLALGRNTCATNEIGPREGSRGSPLGYRSPTPLPRPRPHEPDQREDLVAVGLFNSSASTSKVFEGLVLVLLRKRRRLFQPLNRSLDVLPRGESTTKSGSPFPQVLVSKSPLAKGVVDAAHRLDVLLRHRLLRQPGGFEGLGRDRKRLKAD